MHCICSVASKERNVHSRGVWGLMLVEKGFSSLCFGFAKNVLHLIMLWPRESIHGILMKDRTTPQHSFLDLGLLLEMKKLFSS